VYEHDTPYHHLKVTDDRGIRLLKFERNHQSSMHLDDPFATDIKYVGYLHLTVAVNPAATRTLVVGLGGGSVVKQMWRDYPWMHLDAVELDADVIDVCQELFALPHDERIDVHCADGRDYLERTKDSYDIIILDAFDDDHVPRSLLTDEFLRLCRDHLRPGGVIAYNMIGSVYGPQSKPFRSLHRSASNVWGSVWTFPLDLADGPSENTRNIVMLASDSTLSTEEFVGRIVNRVGGMVSVPAFERFAEDLYQAPIRTGDVPILTDEPQAHRRRRGGR
jgi:spermidine synthase